jgi:hypothetical protein
MAPTRQQPAIPTDASQKRRLSSDEDLELVTMPSTSELLSLTTDEKLRVMSASRKRRKLVDSLGNIQQSSRAAYHVP